MKTVEILGVELKLSRSHDPDQLSWGGKSGELGVVLIAHRMGDGNVYWTIYVGTWPWWNLRGAGWTVDDALEKLREDVHKARRVADFVEGALSDQEAA